MGPPFGRRPVTVAPSPGTLGKPLTTVQPGRGHHRYDHTVVTHSVRGDALLASVKRGGGSYKGPWYNVYRLAAGAVVCEAVLGSVVAVDGGQVVPGSRPGEGALAQLAEHVLSEPKLASIKEWLERTGPWAREAIEGELAAHGLAQGVVRRILLGTDERLRILNGAAQDEVFATVHE